MALTHCIRMITHIYYSVHAYSICVHACVYLSKQGVVGVGFYTMGYTEAPYTYTHEGTYTHMQGIYICTYIYIYTDSTRFS